jgi:hypothetical protein
MSGFGADLRSSYNPGNWVWGSLRKGLNMAKRDIMTVITGVLDQLNGRKALHERLHAGGSETFSAAEIARAQKACEVLGQALKTHPEKVSGLFKAAKKNDFKRGRELVTELGLGAAIGAVGGDVASDDDPLFPFKVIIAFVIVLIEIILGIPE